MRQRSLVLLDLYESLCYSSFVSSIGKTEREDKREVSSECWKSAAIEGDSIDKLF